MHPEMIITSRFTMISQDTKGGRVMRRISLIIVLVAFLAATDVFSVEARATCMRRFDPSGDYHPVNRIEDESEKFTHFDLEVRRRKGRLIAWGDVRTVGTSYKFTSISVTVQRLSFTTVSIRGVRYSFEGRFLGSGDFASQTTDNGKTMLEGTLRKYLDGQKVAETTSPFLYFPGC